MEDEHQRRNPIKCWQWRRQPNLKALKATEVCYTSQICFAWEADMVQSKPLMAHFASTIAFLASAKHMNSTSPPSFSSAHQ